MRWSRPAAGIYETKADPVIVDIIGYRDWAHRLAIAVISRQAPFSPDAVHWHAGTTNELCCADADLTYLVGWSDLAPPSYYAGRTVLVLHPSALPAYRGGSPIQHQIIDGLDESAVTLFRLQDGPVDSGPIAWQRPYSLQGDLADVLERIAEVGAEGVSATIDAFLEGTLAFTAQDESRAFTRKRRQPWESEIQPSEWNWGTARALHDKVRALQDPYPNAFVVLDGKRMYITSTHLESE